MEDQKLQSQQDDVQLDNEETIEQSSDDESFTSSPQALMVDNKFSASNAPASQISSTLDEQLTDS